LNFCLNCKVTKSRPVFLWRPNPDGFQTIKVTKSSTDPISPSGELPVEVEMLLWPLGLKLVPHPSLKEAGDVDALLLGDLKTIIVDSQDYNNDRMQNRIRFSVAHELGHFILHRDLFNGISYTSVNEWIKFMQKIPDDQYAFVEQQAYEFAGRLLVPHERLEKEF